jgi:hypothetical protein
MHMRDTVGSAVAEARQARAVADAADHDGEEAAIDAARAAARKKVLADAAEIARLCVQGGTPGRILTFMRHETPLADVRALMATGAAGGSDAAAATPRGKSDAAAIKAGWRKATATVNARMGFRK